MKVFAHLQENPPTPKASEGSVWAAIITHAPSFLGLCKGVLQGVTCFTVEGQNDSIGVDTLAPDLNLRWNPMALTATDVERIAQLARLALGADERAAMLDQLNGFFRIVERMSAVDTTGVEPLATPLSALHDEALRLRDDVVTEHDERAANQRSAPLVEDGVFLVPRVVE